MEYIKEKQSKITTTKICTLLFQLCVIIESIIGLDPTLYVISKGCMLAFFLVMIIYTLWNKRIVIGKAIIYPILFMVITGLSCLWADYPDAAVSRFSTQVQFYILFFFSYLLFTNEKIDIKKYFDALYISGIGMILYTLYRYGWNEIIQGLNAGQRIGRKIANENIFGMVFSKAAIVAYYYYIKSKKSTLHYTHIILVAFFTLFAFTSGSKKALLMIIVGIIGINVLENGAKKVWKSLIVSVAVLASILLVLQLPVFSTMNQRIMSYFSGDKNASDLMRSKMVDLSIQLFYQKPLFGHGFNNFSIITGLGGYSHNNMTELLVSTGIVGFVIFYIPYVKMIKWGWVEGVKTKNYIVTLFLVLSIIYLVFGYGMVEYYEKGYWIFWGIAVACIDNGTKNKKGSLGIEIL